MTKKKLGPEYIKHFKKLLENWETKADEEPEDEYCDFTSDEDYHAGIIGCVWELDDFLKEHFEDWGKTDIF